MGQKIGRINVGFFTRNCMCMSVFIKRPKKVAVRRGLTETRSRDTNYRHALSNKSTLSVKHFKQFKI